MARRTSKFAVVQGADPPRPGLALNLILSVRPRQWTKNLVIFSGLVFARRLFDPGAVRSASAAFLIFCGLSAAVYLTNDVVDRETDREHPLKRKRPIAAGLVSVPLALTAAVLLTGVALAGSLVLGRLFLLVAACYLALKLLCSTVLTHVVVSLDVLTIATGFVLRAAVGAIAIDVKLSQSLFVCTILLALFIALARRRHELVLLADAAGEHRPNLDEPLPAGPVDRNHGRFEPYRIYSVHDQSGEYRTLRNALAGLDDSVPNLWDFSLLVSRPPLRRWWQPGGPAAQRLPAARVRGELDSDGRVDHLRSPVSLRCPRGRPAGIGRPQSHG